MALKGLKESGNVGRCLVTLNLCLKPKRNIGEFLHFLKTCKIYSPPPLFDFFSFFFFVERRWGRGRDGKVREATLQNLFTTVLRVLHYVFKIWNEIKFRIGLCRLGNVMCAAFGLRLA